MVSLVAYYISDSIVYLLLEQARLAITDALQYFYNVILFFIHALLIQIPHTLSTGHGWKTL